MAKYVRDCFIKISLFAVIMLFTAKFIPYDGLVNFITGLFDFQSAQNFTGFISGEPDPEVWESLRDYFSTLINTLISIPMLSAMITVYHIFIRRISPAGFPKDWAVSTSRRFMKFFTFILLFWVFMRLLPYQYIFPDDEKLTDFAGATIIFFNLLITITCYCFIMKKITTKRSL